MLLGVPHTDKNKVKDISDQAYVRAMTERLEIKYGLYLQSQNPYLHQLWQERELLKSCKLRYGTRGAVGADDVAVAVVDGDAVADDVVV